MEKENYRIITVRDLVNEIQRHKKAYPLGMKTKILSGDFECNNTHLKHELQYLETDEITGEKEYAIVLSYEMNENMGEM